MLKAGDSLPKDVILPTQTGEMFPLADLLGAYSLIYFYPEDDTPGCTKEACAFRDSKSEFEKLGVKVVGVSMDTVNSHVKFIQKYSLNFPLLSDRKGQLVEAFGVWKDENHKGIARSTFAIDPQGKIIKAWEAVKPQGHDQEVLDFFKTILPQ